VVPVTVVGLAVARGWETRYQLVSIHHSSEIDLAGLDGIFECRGDPIRVSAVSILVMAWSYSSGLAGSMITASLLFSSITRYA
jgi:hypothetical protein